MIIWQTKISRARSIPGVKKTTNIQRNSSRPNLLLRQGIVQRAMFKFLKIIYKIRILQRPNWNGHNSKHTKLKNSLKNSLRRKYKMKNNRRKDLNRVIVGLIRTEKEFTLFRAYNKLRMSVKKEKRHKTNSNRRK